MSAFHGTAWLGNQADGLVYAGKVAYIYKGVMPANTSIILLDGTKEIAHSAFKDCTSLTSVTIPDSVTSIGWDAFDGTAWFNNQPNGLVYAGKVAYIYKGAMPANTSIIIIDGTKGIADGAFYECTNLTSITIPNSVTAIGLGAFIGCTGLTSVAIPNGVTSIGDQAFAACKSLTSITIPNSVTTIERNVFGVCTSLASVTIGNGVTSIRQQAFEGCTSLTGVTFRGTIPSGNFSVRDSFPGDLRDKFLAGGIGMYTRPNGSSTTWTKQ